MSGVAEELDIPASIRIEPGVAVQLEFDGEGARYDAITVGLQADQYLILKLSGGRIPQLNKLLSGSGVTVRYVFDGVVYGFHTTSIGTVASPERLIFVAIPRIVAERNLRAHRRYHCVLPVALGAGEEAIQGVALDLSSAGMRVRHTKAGEDSGQACKAMCSVDASIDVAITLPGSEAVKCKAAVRTIIENDGFIDVGFEFEELDESSVSAITNFIDLIQPHSAL